MKKIVLVVLALAMSCIPMTATAQNNTALDSNDRVSIVRQDSNGDATPGSVVPGKLFESIGLGYTTGAGATVEQATSRTTGVTINANTGAITLVSAAGSTTAASFTVTNSKVAATDTIIVNQKSGTDLRHVLVTAVADGSFRITTFTVSGTTTEQPVINFAVVKGATS